MCSPSIWQVDHIVSCFVHSKKNISKSHFQKIITLKATLRTVNEVVQ